VVAARIWGVTVALCEPVAVMSECLERVRGMLSGLDDKGIIQTLRDIEALSRRTHAVMLELLAESDSRGIAAREGFGSTARLVAGMLQLSGSEARTRVAHAAMVGTRRTITGDTLAPQLPATPAGCASLPSVFSPPLTLTDPNPAMAPPRRHRYTASCGCESAATGGWGWRAGWILSTAAWSAL